MKWMFRSTEYARIAMSFAAPFADKEAQFIHPLKVPLHRPFSAVCLKGHLTLSSSNDAAGLKCASSPVCKMCQHACVVFVADRAGWSARTHREMSSLSSCGQGAFPHKRFAHASNTFDWACNHVGHIDHVRHQISQNSQTSQLTLKSPRKHRSWVARISGKETASIVSQVTQLTLLDQFPAILD